MARSGVNKVILVGYLGNEPQISKTQTGLSIANVSLATSENWKDQNGQMQSRVEWHRCVFFSNLADIVGKYLHKGSLIYVEGRLQTRQYVDRNQVQRSITEIVVNEMQMLGSSNNSTRQDNSYESSSFNGSYSNNNMDQGLVYSNNARYNHQGNQQTLSQDFNQNNNHHQNNMSGYNSPIQNKFGANSPELPNNNFYPNQNTNVANEQHNQRNGYQQTTQYTDYVRNDPTQNNSLSQSNSANMQNPDENIDDEDIPF